MFQAVHEIRTAVEKRDVPYLVHFTQASNLASILAYGIYPVSRFDELPVSPKVNDLLRMDGYKEANCVSIGFPNNLMLYKYRLANKDCDWVVLKLDRTVLWNKRCAFCKHNAASKSISETPLHELMTPQAFEAMFDDVPGQPVRSNPLLFNWDPTDVQAEVLVFNVIETSFIKSATFGDSRTRSKYGHLKEKAPNVTFNIDTMFFSNRRQIRELAAT